jgi:hypothetical protein
VTSSENEITTPGSDDGTNTEQGVAPDAGWRDDEPARANAIVSQTHDDSAHQTGPVMTGKKCLILVAIVSLASAVASAQDPGIQSATRSAVTDEMVGRQFPPLSLKRSAIDPQYGLTERKPVMVQGGLGEGGHNVYRFLNALRGPQGEAVHYKRIGTCCEFETKKSPFGDGKELLEVYEVAYEGGPSRRLYFNWYDDGEILFPVGFTASKLLIR